MTATRERALLLSLVVACASCGGSSLGGSGGSGGSGGTSAGGTGGVAGTSAGGTGGVDGAEAHVPRCIADLIAACTCKVAADGCGPRTCFVAGVTTTTTNLDGGTCGGPGDAEEKHVLKPDGSVCYSTRTFWVPLTGGCESVSVVWYDPAGNMVASARGTPGFEPCAGQLPYVTCTATGETGSVPFNAWPRSDCPANGCQ